MSTSSTANRKQPAPDTESRIDAVRAKLGNEVSILAHHYQSDAITAHADRVGDSLELARMIEDISARHIVMCGVHFMAETACLLAAPEQKIYMPATDASCVMADMTPAPLLNAVMARLLDTGRKIVPLAYANTSLAVKAIVGKFGGAVCTSANAGRMMKWALAQGDSVFFLPDQKLGNNVANQVGLPLADRYVLDIRHNGQNLDDAAIAGKRLLLWPGCCAVHAKFNAAQAQIVRKQYPNAQILVHPECSPAMVASADGAGSTSYLIRAADNAPDGSILVIGTEINLIKGLAKKQAGRITILPLASAACSNMSKITPAKLLDCLQGIAEHSAGPLSADPALLSPGRTAITRMLEHGV